MCGSMALAALALREANAGTLTRPAAVNFKAIATRSDPMPDDVYGFAVCPPVDPDGPAYQPRPFRTGDEAKKALDEIFRNWYWQGEKLETLTIQSLPAAMPGYGREFEELRANERIPLAKEPKIKSAPRSTAWRDGILAASPGIPTLMPTKIPALSGMR